MSVTDEAKHRIYEAFRASHGEQIATDFMEIFPPSGWAEVATRSDVARVREDLDLRIDALEERTNLRFDSLEERMDLRFEAFEARLGERLEHALREQSNRFLGWLFATAGTSLAIAGAFSQLR